MPKKGYMFGKKKRNSKPRGRHATKAIIHSVPVFSSPPPLAECQESSSHTDATHKISENNIISAAEKKQNLLQETVLPINTSDLSYSIVSFHFLSSLVSSLCCPHCYQTSIRLSCSSKVGLAEKFDMECSKCYKNIDSYWTAPKVQGGSKIFDINTRSVVALKECGISYAKFSNFCSIMSLPKYLHRNNFAKIGKKVHAAVISASEECMNKAAAVVHERSLAKPADRTSKTGCPVITVSFDETWHKRGHSSHTGVGTVIDFNSGLILDTQVISNFCKGCQYSPKPSSQNFNKLQESHRNKCQKNFSGTANSMEAESACLIFSRSISKRNLIYGTMLCDGDSKSHTAAVQHSGYDLEIVKEDCINHISKRMYNALENLKVSHKKELNYKLTKPKIEKVTNVYATSLRHNAPDVDKMKLAVMGSFFHMLSTDKEPNHKLCPDGETSWCHFKRAQALKQAPRKHTPTFSSTAGKLIFPIIKRLTEPELLQRCAKMGTQNANESFHSLIWTRCPKSLYASFHSVETATHLAILSFNCGNFGIKRVFDNLSIPWTYSNDAGSIKAQVEKVKNARKRTHSDSK